MYLLQDAIDRFIVAHRVMVGQQQLLDAGIAAQAHRVLHGAVAPADLGGILPRGVLAVMDHHVGAGNEIGIAPVGAGHGEIARGERGRMRLVVAAVRKADAVDLEAITQRERRVVQVARHDADVIDAERALDQIVVLDVRDELVQRDRKVGVLHLAGQRSAQALRQALGAVDVPGILAHEQWRKEGDSLNVVPVGVADQQVAVLAAALVRKHLLAQRMTAGAAIADHQRAGIRADLDARSIATVTGGSGSRLGNGAAGSPELNSHGDFQLQVPAAILR